MGLTEQLQMELSRRNTNEVARYVGNDTGRFRELMNLVLNGTPPLPHRAAWAVSTICDTCPELLRPYLPLIVEQIEKFGHPGIRRSLLRNLSEMEIPVHLQGKLFDVCYRWVQSKEEPPGIKVYAMQILVNIARPEPDLLREVHMIIEELTDHESAAIRSRSKHLLAGK